MSSYKKESPENLILKQLNELLSPGILRANSENFSRQLTDGELMILNQSYIKGLRDIKNHKWHSSSEAEEPPYWKVPIKRIG